MPCSKSCQNAFFGIAILLNMVCGFFVTITAAFFGHGVPGWGYAFVGVFSTLSLFVIFFSIKAIRCESEEETSFPLSLKWICGLYSVGTLLIFIGIFVLVEPQRNQGILIGIAATLQGLELISLFAVDCYQDFIENGSMCLTQCDC